jgi:hypothetical protein
MENLDLRDITKDIGDIIRNKINDIIIAISVDYNLDEGELLNKYLPNIQINQENTKIKRKRKKISTELCCIGRKQFGEQCTRRKKDGSEFCGSHMKSLPYGRIGDEKEFLCKIPGGGKRGRKKKKELYNEDEYIETWVDTELGNNYLIDKYNTVYTNDINNPEIIGKKNEDTGEIDDIKMNINNPEIIGKKNEDTGEIDDIKMNIDN